jgi:ribosomal-protein-alanine N-acetyltransferase
MKVTLHKAKPSDLPIVKNLVPYYIYDMSEYMGWATKPDGRHDGCDGIEDYWTDADKHAFILRAGREPAGFVLLLEGGHGPLVDYSITDFFVLRKFRHRGVGERIAREFFNRFPGRWQVDHLKHNKPAAIFWRKIISRFTRDKFKTKSAKCKEGPVTVFLFETRKNPGPFAKARRRVGSHGN